LKEAGTQVVGLSSKDADLRDPTSLDRFGSDCFDRIFHLAAWTQAGDFCLHHLGEQWLINQQINTTVLGFWQQHQPQAKLISMGTSCAYEEGSDLAEDKYLVGTPIADLYTYAMTKRMLVVGQQSIQKQFGLTWLTLVPSTVYGPGYHIGTKQMHFIFDLAWKVLAYRYHGDPIVLWGDGYQRRELVFIEDFITIMMRLDQEVSNDIVNIGAGEDHSIREFAGLLCELLNVDPSIIQYDTDRYVGARTKFLSVKHLDRLLPQRPRTPLREGLLQTLRWLEPKFREMNSSRRLEKIDAQSSGLGL
jgi:GDP-L-fucose synthase